MYKLNLSSIVLFGIALGLLFGYHISLSFIENPRMNSSLNLPPPQISQFKLDASQLNIESIKQLQSNSGGLPIQSLLFQTDDGFVCDFRMEYLFNETIRILHSLKHHNYMPTMMCPDFIKIGWRPDGYQPMFQGNKCEPWWHRDAVFIISHLLNKGMKVFEYGGGISTLWIALRAAFVVTVDNSKEWMADVSNFSQLSNINNIELRYENLRTQYGQSINLSGNPGDFDWYCNQYGIGGIDLGIVDGRMRQLCLRTIIPMLKPNGGILLFDNSDRNDTDGYQSLHLVPKHWLKYASFNLDTHVAQLDNQRWLKNAQTTIWISRHPKCIQFIPGYPKLNLTEANALYPNTNNSFT